MRPFLPRWRLPHKSRSTAQHESSSSIICNPDAIHSLEAKCSAILKRHCSASHEWTFSRVGMRHVIACMILATHAVLLLAPMRQTFITVDEVMHLASGISYWKVGRFWSYRVNPPLPKMLAVLPALAAQPRTDFHTLRDIPTERSEYTLGPAFLELNRTRIFDLVCLGRLAGVVWSVLGGWLIYRWAGELYGAMAAFLALILWCIEPYVLGHAPLLTSDIPAAVTGLAAARAYSLYLRTPTWRRAIIAGILLGVAALTKFTLIILFPLWPAVWAVSRCVANDINRNLRAEFGQLLFIAVVGLDIINLGYGFQGSFERLGNYSFVSQLMTGDPTRTPNYPFAPPGNRFRGTWIANLPIPLPEDFLRGLDVQRVDMEGRWPSYLAGVWREKGWWYYYLYALAVKLPLGTLILIVWGTVLALIPRGVPFRRGNDSVILSHAVTIAIFVSSQTGYTQHSRYIIPALPFLVILAARPVGQIPRVNRHISCVVCALLIAAVVSSLAVYPHSLAYFNEAAGGPLRGHDHLLDSNIDWGQDLIRLKQWVDRHPEANHIKLAYYNLIDPRIIGLNFELPPPGLGAFPTALPPDLQTVGPTPGYYAVSVNILRGYEFPIHDGHGKLHQIRPHEFEYLHWFRPIGRAGYSIYLYRITPKEADAARRRMGLPAWSRRHEYDHSGPRRQ